jgi:CheY-specific phosphatase CheX
MNDPKLLAFVDATRTTFQTMLGIDARPGGFERGHGVTTGYDVSGIVGLANLEGPAERQASLVLSFPEAVARRAVGRILGLGELPILDQEVADGIGELVSVIAGLAKRGLARAGIHDCQTTLPNVILGCQHRVFHQREAERFAAPFESEIGGFLLQVILLVPIDKEGARGARPTAAPAV